MKVVSLLGGDDSADEAIAAAAATDADKGAHVDVYWKPTLNIRVVTSEAGKRRAY